MLFISYYFTFRMDIKIESFSYFVCKFRIIFVVVFIY